MRVATEIGRFGALGAPGERLLNNRFVRRRALPAALPRALALHCAEEGVDGIGDFLGAGHEHGREVGQLISHDGVDDGRPIGEVIGDGGCGDPYLAGDGFSYGDVPVGIMAYRYRQLVPERPPFPHFERWYAAIAARPAFKAHVSAVPLT